MTIEVHTPQDALYKLAVDHGFQTIRTTGTHRFIKKSSATFKLPILEDANEHMRGAILRICNEVDARSHRAPGSRKPLPLAVNYQGETWAVFTANASQYNLQSLEDGHRIWVAKLEVEVVSEDELRIREPQPDPEALARIAAAKAAESEMTPEIDIVVTRRNGSEPPAPAPRPFALTELEELDPMRFWVVTTERQIANFQKRIDKIMEDLQPLVDRRDALKRALEAATQTAPAPGPVVKRFTLNSAGKPRDGQKRARGGSSPETIQRTRDMLKAHPELKNQEVANRVGGGISASMVSYYRNHPR